MKKMVSLAMSAIFALASINLVPASENYADREYVISEFVQAAGRNSFSNRNADLSDFKDGSDVDAEYAEDMRIAIANGIVNGYNDHTLKPDDYITRAEAAVILSKCIGNVAITESEKHFTDVPQWAADAVNKLTQGGIINGYDDTTFGSNDNITYEQVRILTNKVEQNINKNNLKDDFYKYYNDKFLRNNNLNSSDNSLSNFSLVENAVNSRINNIIEESRALSDNESKRITDTYNLFMDRETRNKEGIIPLMTYIESIDNINSIKDIPNLEAELYNGLGISFLLNFDSALNPDDSSKYIAAFGESSTLLTKPYYFDFASDVKKDYNSFVSLVLGKAGVENPKDMAEKVFEFEKKIVQKTDTTNYDAYQQVYTKYNINELCSNINGKAFIELLSPAFDEICVYNTEQLRQMDAAAANEDIETIKAYYKTMIIAAFGSYLSDDIYRSYNTLYKYTDTDYTRGAADFVKSYAGVAIVNKYSAKYFSSEKEQKVRELVNDIKANYKTRILNNGWLSKETKNKAINKLDKINIKVGYFKTPMPYSKQITITSKENGGTLIDNVISVNKILGEYTKSLPGTGVNKNYWAISPLMTNACYIPSGNEIIIPMGILESPFYDENASYEENLGGIGFVIAHEISHAFDPAGANYDENGNYTDWWTEEDKNKFYDLANDVIEYFNMYEVANGVDNDGELTLLESVADLASLSCTTEIAREKGLSSKKVMESYARVLGGIFTDEYSISLAKSDGHPVSKIRVNAVLSSTDAFYDDFCISENDGMYKSPENRVKIW